MVTEKGLRHPREYMEQQTLLMHNSLKTKYSTQGQTYKGKNPAIYKGNEIEEHDKIVYLHCVEGKSYFNAMFKRIFTDNLLLIALYRMMYWPKYTLLQRFLAD